MKFFTKQQATRLERRLARLYGDQSHALMERFYMMLGRYGVGYGEPASGDLWDQNDVVLITYADTLRGEDEAPLKTLREFCNTHLRNRISTVHLLPFFPWSSDDGFSVIDYRKVAPENGEWKHVTALGNDFDLMFDLVLNHCSRESTWFKEYVTGVAPSRYYFLPTDPQEDLSEVVRPRPWPLLTEVHTRDGKAHVWTTFSEDQVDLNWANPDVLFEFLDILFFYLSQGCRIFRLDAVAFLWKKLGTNCLHLPETHEVVRLFRDVLEVVAPDAILLTETNVPHEENISYFGKGNEAHMVYNFSLPPLLLHGLLRGDSTQLTAWARTLPDLPKKQAFFNFTASHDGIGVRPLQGILDDTELAWIADTVRSRGGEVSMRAMPDGSERPYELNCSYRDALSVPDDEELSIARFLCSQAVALAFKGIPAVYIQSLLGTPNWREGFERTKQKRTLNRRQWEQADLAAVLADKESPQARVFARYTQWLSRRRGHPAFHPNAAQEIRDFGPELFCFVRISVSKEERVVCLFNFTAEPQTVELADLDPSLGGKPSARDLLSGTRLKAPKGKLTLEPYFAYWLTR